jgi:membrane protease YdiL (CAAX protease family)
MPLPGGLPAPVERFYRQIYGENVPVITSAVITTRAKLRLPSKGGITFPARFRFTHDAGKGYRHYIEATFFGLPLMRVNEHYLDGKSRLETPFGVGEGTIMNTRKQLSVFAILLAVNAFLAFAAYTWLPPEQIFQGQTLPPELESVPGWQFGLGNAGIVLVLYGGLGLIGFWLARKAGLPGIFREGAGWRAWVFVPLVTGLIVGILIVGGDLLFTALGDQPGFPHPLFPLSLIASAIAGIGEEILFRLFVMSLWAFLLNLLLRRWNATNLALWLANIIAAFAFAAGHLPAVMVLLNVASPAQLPPLVLAEIFLLNSLLALAAGERFMRDGLVAAVGVHFWADIVWHVVFPVIGV